MESRNQTADLLLLFAAVFSISACRGEANANKVPQDTASTVTTQAPPSAPGIAPAFASSQVTLGQKVYFSECVRCHTADRFVGQQFSSIWANRRVYDLYDIVSSTMPQDAPGNLSTEQYLDVVAFMLQINGAKPGKDKLTSDSEALKKMRIGVASSVETK